MVYAKVREIPEMVHEKQPKYQKWYMDTQMVYAKAEEIPEMVHIYYGIKTK